MDLFTPCVAFVLGLVFGSFFNVLIYRLPLDRSIIRPGSRCPECNHAIRPWENIPLISFMLLGGKCSNCKHAISLQYPLVELLTGFAAVILWIFVLAPGLSGSPSFFRLTILAVQSIVLLVLIPLSIIDIKHYIIPDVFTLPGIAAAVVISFFPGKVTPFECVLGIAVGGGSLFLAGFMGKLLFKKDEAMGGGDVRLMAMIGGLWGWKLSIAVIVLASFLGSIVGIGLLAFGLLAKDDKLPFGPFLALAAWAAVLTFDKLFGLYRAWLG